MTLGELANLLDAAKQWEVFDPHTRIPVKPDAVWITAIKETVAASKKRHALMEKWAKR